MHYGKTKTIAILGLPLLLVLALFVTKVALTEADMSEHSLAGPRSGERVSPAGIAGIPSIMHSTSAVTGSLSITGVLVSDIKATSAVVAWTTNEASDSVVRYGTASDALTITATSPVTGTEHAVGLANLTPSTQYFFEVESTDAEGDTAIDDDNGALHTFTTLEAELVRRAFVGTVVGDPGDTVTLVREGTGEEVTIILPDAFSLKTPGGPRSGTFEDGARVVILAQLADNDWVALRVLVKPVKPLLPVVGVVTGVGPTSVTLLDSRGEPHLLRLDNSRGDLVPGEVITVFRGNSNRARGLVRAEEVRNRMQRQLETIAEGDNRGPSPGEPEINEKRANALIRSLELHGNQEINTLDRALQQAPEEVKDKIRAAKARSQKGVEAAQASIVKARGRFEESGSPGSGNNSNPNSNPGPDNAGGQGNGVGQSGNSNGQGNAGDSSGGQGRGNSGRGSNAGGQSDRGGGPGNSGDRGNSGGQGKSGSKGKP